MSAPVSMSALQRSGPAAVATRSRIEVTVQVELRTSILVTAGEVSVASIFPSSPFSKQHCPSSTGSRFDGVPEKPRRRPKTRLPPTSCPEADSFWGWNRIVRGKTWLLRYHSITWGSLRSSLKSMLTCSLSLESTMCSGHIAIKISGSMSCFSFTASKSPFPSGAKLFGKKRVSRPLLSFSGACSCAFFFLSCDPRTRPPASSIHSHQRMLEGRSSILPTSVAT
mmetsp:Transcript_40089/g.98532  ORF Transcript_40089/g.98532 Transcript_40089/m.98532 type:complete len:224 (-) Transcript_40089:949-1620(-)